MRLASPDCFKNDCGHPLWPNSRPDRSGRQFLTDCACSRRPRRAAFTAFPTGSFRRGRVAAKGSDRSHSRGIRMATTQDREDCSQKSWGVTRTDLRAANWQVIHNVQPCCQRPQTEHGQGSPKPARAPHEVEFSASHGKKSQAGAHASASVPRFPARQLEDCRSAWNPPT